jgi:coenzyme Q-binding protein COQ10
MRHYSTTRDVAYSAEQMFDLVARVERYPEFLHGWRAVRVIGRDERDALIVEQIVGLGPLRWRFASRALHRRPHQLRIGSTDSPFERLEIDWRFAALSDDRCTITFEAICALRSSAVEALAADFLDASFGDIVFAFERRARKLYSPADHVKNM